METRERTKIYPSASFKHTILALDPSKKKEKTFVRVTRLWSSFESKNSNDVDGLLNTREGDSIACNPNTQNIHPHLTQAHLVKFKIYDR